MNFAINTLVTIKNDKTQPDVYKIIRIPNTNSSRAFYSLQLEFVNIYGTYYSARNPTTGVPISTRKAIHRNIIPFNSDNIPGGLMHF